jgi:glutathione synthase/RimK-type ligase-like ATP-grasp enzyme
MRMISFGMMSLTLNSERSYFTEMARRADADTFICYRFAPTKIHPISHLIQGEVFDRKKDAWRQDEFPVPQILYDRCFYSDDIISKQSLAIVKWLKSRDDLTFLGNGLPNKWAIYDALSKSPLAPYVPQTFKATDGESTIAKLRIWNKVILKPAFGSGGNGIYTMEKKNRTFLITADLEGGLAEKTFHSQTETEVWLDQLFAKKEYLVQSFLELTDAEKRPFDIRVLLQKDSTGNWIVRGKGIRRGSKLGIVSNLTAGGEIVPFEEYTASMPKKSMAFICDELEEILMKLPEILETSFPRLFELGIDIGVSQNHALWILDTNSKPGRKVLLHKNPELKDVLYKAPLCYALYLANNLSEREEQHS